jgi:hypothetical protein
MYAVLFLDKLKLNMLKFFDIRRTVSIAMGDLFMQIVVLITRAPCSLVEIYRRFRGACRLHHQGGNQSNRAEPSHISNRFLARGLLITLMMEAASTFETSLGKLPPDYTAQQTTRVIFILVAVRTSNLT